MPVWAWFFIAALVLIAIAGLIVAASAGRRKRTDSLKQQFGPEYERTVADVGEQQAAEKELVARKRERDKLDIRPLTRDALQAYSQRWRHVQTAFVDNPSSALDDADRLLMEVMRERGYPVDDFDQRAADISVDHPTVVENYRAAHAIHVSNETGDAGTEKQRQAFVHYRALFDKLLEDNDHRPQATDTNRRQAHDHA
jgi:hypothetical protein